MTGKQKKINKFHMKVYDAICNVPLGRVTTYKEVAQYLNSSAYRAVGRALALNPNAPKVPCHRVVKSNGDLGGYTSPGGIAEKISLLKEEGIEIQNSKVADFDEKFFSLKAENLQRSM